MVCACPGGCANTAVAVGSKYELKRKTQKRPPDSPDMVTTSQISSSNSPPISQPSLSKFLKRLRKKAKENSLPITANGPSRASEEYPIIDPLFLPSFGEKGSDKEARWAAIWLNRLQLRKKRSRNGDKSQSPSQSGL